MVNLLGSALPQFSKNEIKNLKRYKSDFLGINHYTSYFIQDCLISTCNSGDGASRSEGFALKLIQKGNIPIGEVVSKFVFILPKNYHYGLPGYILFYNTILKCFIFRV